MSRAKKKGDSLLKKSGERCVFNEDKKQLELKQLVYKLISDGLTNLEISSIAKISYEEVILYRISYEKGSKRNG